MTYFKIQIGEIISTECECYTVLKILYILQKQSKAWMSHEKKMWIYDRLMNSFHVFAVIFCGRKFPCESTSLILIA